MPLPQATVGGRAQWSRPVAEDWVEARRRSSEGLRDAMSAGDRHHLAPGAAQIRDRFSETFFSFLWKRPDIRKRWVLRQRNEPSVREVADQLAFEVADSLRRIIPTDALGPTIRHAVLEDFATSLRVSERRGGQLKAFDLILSVPLAKMLSWFIQHFPTSATVVRRRDHGRGRQAARHSRPGDGRSAAAVRDHERGTRRAGREGVLLPCRPARAGGLRVLHRS